jgi:hypothetical protein
LRRRHLARRRSALQRSELTAIWELPNPAFHEAGTWRGSDIAAAATIVASSKRRVHMFVTSVDW